MDIKILAQLQHNGRAIDVEITNVITTGDGRQLVTVQTLDGMQPFTEFSFCGGAVDSDTTHVRRDCLEDIHQGYSELLDEFRAWNNAAMAEYTEARSW